MRLLKLKDVMFATGLARSTVYKYIAENNFPKPVSLGERNVAWVEDEINNWIAIKIKERDEAATAA
ncbi:AlpA family transcriptional regulator [Kushneria marisflavi]|uniref:AlpA family transcriptional regulator n=1 Tax=Kushneria marisflavi TaxID=157779 RepID=A0A240UT54_9GAMM|nr:AlpA family transcriptional regulator [Kushneria marisflavi]ART64681.1 AlpA family transcriptional regulator [Kushneria marisflavi]RKD84593.1 AlpA family transcriptional regulator [Kushneria marisflavi]